jgi:Mpv17 / PMP22 family
MKTRVGSAPASFLLLTLAASSNAFAPSSSISTPQRHAALQRHHWQQQLHRQGPLFSTLTESEKDSQTGSSNSEEFDYIQDRMDRTERINTVALTNAAVVGACIFSALYCLFAEKVQALAALYDYGLGPTDHSGITYMAVSLDLLARMPVDAVHAYEALIPTNPIFFKACTSGVAYALGDFLSQIYQGRTLENVDLPRSARSGAAGFVAHGPLCHFWLLFMETYLDFDGAWWATGIKVTADLTVWSIFLNFAYSTIIGLLAFRSPAEVFEDVKATAWPALRSAWRFWPFVHTVSFSHAVPLDLKLLWVDVMEVVWVTILSKVANEDKIAKLEEAEVAAADGEGSSLEVVTVLESHNVTPDLEIELTREEELKTDKPLAFELPQKALAACWPLIAMWPVLWLGYQVEDYLGLVPHA